MLFQQCGEKLHHYQKGSIGNGVHFTQISTLLVGQHVHILHGPHGPLVLHEKSLSVGTDYKMDIPFFRMIFRWYMN
jgi:hypothetical protein